jgi:ribonuclease P protein component
MRYARQQHLRSATDFQRIRASGTKWECGFFYVTFLESPAGAAPVRRLGVVASRRVGNAVARNRAKRLMRELFRLNQQQLPPACDLVMVARSSITRAGFADLQRRFQGALRRHAHPAG